MARLLKLATIAAVLGAANAAAFLVFEYIVNHGTQYIWNDLFNSDEVRWLVIPLAVTLSIIYSAVIVLFKQRRIIEPHLNPLDSSEEKDNKLPTLGDIGAVFVIGVSSLLAGASLGPEASLVAICSGLGLWIAKKSNSKPASKLLALSGVGSLLVAFFGSLLPILLALLILHKQQKKLDLLAVIPVICGLATYVTLHLFGHAEGFGEIPADGALGWQDYLWAFVLGALCTPIATNLKRAVAYLFNFIKEMNDRLHWLISGALFGSVLGLLYLAGGETIQFSGSAGTAELIANNPSYSILALVGLLLAKLAVTAWSLASGYRGGMIFPSVYMGVALALILHSLLGGLPQTGLMVGSIAGIFTAILGSPVVSLLMVASLLHLKFVGIAVAGAAGAAFSQKAIQAYKQQK